MKIKNLFLALLCTLQLVAQTAPPPNTLAFFDQIQNRARDKYSMPTLFMQINGKTSFVQLDPTLILNLATNPPTLSAPAAKPQPVLTPQIETFQIATAASIITLGFIPAPNTLACYRNGMRLSAGFDYTQTAAVLTFTAGVNTNAPQVGDLFACDYQH